MKLDVNTLITNLAGVALKIGTGAPGEKEKDVPDLTLGAVLINAALTPSGTKTYDEKEHIARYALALDADKAAKHDPSVIDVSADTAAMIKKDIARIYAPLIAGQVLPMLDGK